MRVEVDDDLLDRVLVRAAFDEVVKLGQSSKQWSTSLGPLSVR
jgi:hypothetical protein